MKDVMFQIEKKFAVSLLIFIVISLLGTGKLRSNLLNKEEETRSKIEETMIYQETSPNISETDLYCSFFILDKGRLIAEIVSSEKEEEKMLLSDSDIFLIDRGIQDGLELGQVFLILEIGPKIVNPITKKDLGHLGLKRGRGRIIDLGETWGRARVEKACGQVMVGNFLIPFKEKEDILEKSYSSDVSQKERKSLNGNIVYLESEYQTISRDQWALIDLGSEDGLRFGDKMNIYEDSSDKLTKNLVGDLIVIDTQRKTSTVKILSSSDVIQIGAQVEIKESEQ